MASSLALAEFAELHIGHAWNAVGEGVMRGAFMKRSEEDVIAYVEQERQNSAASLDNLMRQVAALVDQGALDYLKPQMHLVKGWARKVIPVLAKQIEADLVVMETVARIGIAGFGHQAKGESAM